MAKPVRARRPRVERFRLRNGLSVVLAPIAKSSTVSVWVWYRVGSKNERPGITGASHWVEHMLFQGSPHYRKGEIDRAVVKVGGSLNAFTDYDFTAYFSTVPRDHLSVPLDIESDRMTRALLEPAEIERERTVIRSEQEGNENWPEFRVAEELGELAFRRHPYRWDPLGFPEDLVALTPRDLREYYRRFYGTRNAVLVVSGGFEPSQVRRQIRALFGRLPTLGEVPDVAVVEPEPTGERRATLSGPGTTPYLEVGYRAPAVQDPGAPAAILLDVVLGGETRLFTVGRGWGPSGEHPSARIYRALVDRGLAVRATTQYRPRQYPGVFLIGAQAARGVSLDQIEEVIHRETGRISRFAPARSEVLEARRKVRRGAQLAYEGASGIGFRLGYFSMLGGERFESDLLSRVLSVSPEAVRAAAERLFPAERRVVVGYEPSREAPNAG
ncbi:MAG: insulinase family protein [Thermoplasmata archaeon]|nr:insulinase family protein [Thermoplasmata archaeon]MCI4359469.1 insulinase family protein [Thermoplasmata archaeon]